MKVVLLGLLLLWQAGATPGTSTDVRQYSRYERSVMHEDGGEQTCAVLDAQIFPHAAASLKDLRLYQGDREIPYVITLSEPAQMDNVEARVLNLGMRGRSIVFDLQMPDRPYTDVRLDLAGQNYLATATVTGKNVPGADKGTNLGEFTVFDLTAQHLSRNTTLHLQESNFPYLHVILSVASAPGGGFAASQQMVKGATVPPSRERQSLYTVVEESTAVKKQGRDSVAAFTLPERVPVERVSFAIAPEFKGNFSRDVRISDRPQGAPKSEEETIDGTIFRVQLKQAGREVHQQQLSVPATLGANMQGPASAEVAVNNGDDAPLAIASIRLEMRQRKLCFTAPAKGAVTLYYGDDGLGAPQYDYARFFSATAHSVSAQLGPEQRNPGYRPRPDARPLTERYPDLLWIALLAVICVLAMVALRSARGIRG